MIRSRSGASRTVIFNSSRTCFRQWRVLHGRHPLKSPLDLKLAAVLALSPPLEAVKYQILVMFLLAAGTGFGTMAAGG